MPLDPVTAAAVRALGGEIAQLHRRIAALEAGSRTAGLKYSSIDGGQLTVTDGAGTVRQVIGAQPDGTVTTVDLAAAPPAAPSAPLAAAGIGSLIIGWDGLLGGAQPLSDFLYTEVHVSATPGFTPSAADLARTMQAGGVVTVAGLTPGTTYYVALVAVNRARASSAPSPLSAGVPYTTTQTIPAGSITPGLLSFSAGGQTVSVGSTAPPSPNAGDLWFDTANSSRLNQWSGSAWTAYQYGTGAIAAGAITTPLIAAGAVTAAQIAAGTITATQLAAHTITATEIATGIVIANIVNGTTITGSTLQNSSSNPRTSINPDGSITITNTAGTVIFRIGPDGTIYWYSTAGLLLMTLQPGGTQLIYASLTGPSTASNEPPQPALLFATTSTASAAAYATAAGAPVPAGQVVTVAASCNSSVITATGVTDSGGNSYTLLQSQSSASPTQQVFQAVISTALAATDTITVTYSATAANAKCMVATATAGLAAAPLDYSAQATGTSTAPSVAGTPTAWGDAVLMIISNATATPPSAVPDGWQLAGQTSASGTQTTSIYYSVNLAASGALTASATLASSVVWTAVTLGYLVAPAQPFAAYAPVPTAAAVSASTQWADEGNFSLKVTKAGTATTWGVTYPAFPVQPGSLIAIRLVIGTLSIALGNFEYGFNWWSGPNGTGSSLGSAFWPGNAIPFNVFVVLLGANAQVPAGAQSATLYAVERQADTAGNYFLIDGIHVPGGLAYSNSPVATTDPLGNPVPQGLNFNGLPGVTNVLGITDPYTGAQIAGIDGQGNVSGQVVNAGTDLLVGGQSVPNDLISPLPLGIVNYGFKAVGGTAWPSTAIGSAETALLELDQVCQPNRLYEFTMNQTLINAVGGAGSMHLHLRTTLDGSTPTTSSNESALTACRVENAGTDAPIGPLRCQFGPYAGLTTVKCLVTGHAGTNSFQFKNDDFIRVAFYDLGAAVPTGTNNLIVLGTAGTGGTSSPQTYTEHFYANNTWTYWEFGQKSRNGSLYQGGYSGEGYAQYSYMQWSQGDLGNSLNVVLNYTVKKVSLRLLCQHTWYNSGATVSWHSSTALGSATALSSELAAFHVTAGAYWELVLPSSAWTPFKAGGITYGVLRPPGGSLDLSYYSYFWGGGTNNSNVPRLTVTYTH